MKYFPIFLAIIAVLNFVFFVIGKLDALIFWIVLIIIYIFSKYVAKY